MNPYQRIVITLFCVILAVLIFVETRILYSGEIIPMVAIQAPDGGQYTLILKDGALAVWRIVRNALWMLPLAVAGFVWAAPLKKKQG